MNDQAIEQEIQDKGLIAPRITRDNVGVTPGIDPAVWLSEIQAKRPHWWGEMVGTGAEQMAKSAGTFIGGGKPLARK